MILLKRKTKTCNKNITSFYGVTYKIPLFLNSLQKKFLEYIFKKKKKLNLEASRIEPQCI